MTHGRSHMELGAVSNQNFVILGAAPPLFRPWHQTAYRAGIKELVTYLISYLISLVNYKKLVTL